MCLFRAEVEKPMDPDLKNMLEKAYAIINENPSCVIVIVGKENRQQIREILKFLKENPPN